MGFHSGGPGHLGLVSSLPGTVIRGCVSTSSAHEVVLVLGLYMFINQTLVPGIQDNNR